MPRRASYMRSMLALVLAASALADNELPMAGGPCSICPEGTHYNGLGCVACGPGMYSPSGDPDTCKPCPPGSFSAAGGASACSQCTNSLIPEVNRTDDPRTPSLMAASLRYLNSARAGCASPLLAGGQITNIRTTLFGQQSLLVRAEISYGTPLFEIKATIDQAGAWQVVSAAPPPCDNTSALAFSVTELARLQTTVTTWKPQYPPEADGKLIKIQPPPKRRALPALAPPLPGDVVMPTDFDLRDVYPTERQCAAFASVRNQGSLGTCPVFAASTAFAATLCLQGGRDDPMANILVSIQQEVDCFVGGDYNAAFYPDTVAGWYGYQTNQCSEQEDPFQGKAGVCRTNCSGFYAGAGVQLPNMYLGQFMTTRPQRELMLNGPLHVSINVYNDLFGYAGGIYTQPSPTATLVGAHSLVMIGWGAESGTPYWTLQNSWGAGWGESGCLRILRGADVLQLESTNYRVISVAPVTKCANNTCSAVSTVMPDCSCSCVNTFLTGPSCTVCSATCQNKGTMNSLCTKCNCLPGYSGPLCQYYVALTKSASLVNDTTKFSITWKYNSSDGNFPPTGQSMVAFYKPGVTSPYQNENSVVYCGTSTGANCADTGRVYIVPPAKVGVYLVYSSLYTYGTTPGIYPIDSSYSTYLGNYTVLPATAGSAGLAAAQLSSGPLAAFNAQNAAAAAAAAVVSAQMQARLALRAGVVDALLAIPPASINVTNLKPDGTIWYGGQTQVCYFLPPHLNAPSKTFMLFPTNPTQYYATGVGFFGGVVQDLGNASSACVFVRITMTAGTQLSLGIVPFGGINSIVQSSFFTTKRIQLFYKSLTNASGTAFTLEVDWMYGQGGMTKYDIVQLYDPNGQLYDWAYAQTGNKNLPTSATIGTGYTRFSINRRGTPGQYVAYMYYNNTMQYYAQQTDGPPPWNWDTIGWLPPLPPTTAKPTTAKPTTAAPTTAKPTTIAPTTVAPTTAAPTTAKPTTTVAPTTAAPTTPKPTTAAPTTAAPTTSTPQPTTAAPTTLKPTTSTAAPTTAAPTTPKPTTVAPTTPKPTTAAPTTSTAAPTTSTPKPTTAAPTTSTAAPTTSTAAPTTSTAAPTTSTAAPTTSTAAPTTSTAAPTTSTAAPTTSTAAPTTSTAAPTTSTAAPTTSTAAPTTSTAAPTTSTADTSTQPDTSADITTQPDTSADITTHPDTTAA